MKSVDAWLEEYGESHENGTNKTIHWLCVPAIMFSLMGLLWCVPTPALFARVPLLNWATLFLALATLYYLTLSLPLTVGMLLVAIGITTALHALAGAGVSLWMV